MPSCCIRQCSARKNINRPELTFHRFPVNEIGKKKWLEVIGIEYINPRHKTWYVCSMHFDESCFNRTLDVTRLRVGAMPSLSLQTTSACHLQPSTSSVMVADKSSKPTLFKIQNTCEVTGPTEVKLREANLDINASIAKIPQQNEKIKNLTEKCGVLQKKVRRLSEMVRRRDKKIARFSNIIKDLQNRNFINNEEKIILEECTGPEDLLKRQIAKSKGLLLQKKILRRNEKICPNKVPLSRKKKFRQSVFKKLL